jgi:hypothetical protein
VRYADDSGDHFYYVVRARDQETEIADGTGFDNLLMFKKPEPDCFAEWYIRATLAEAPPDRVAKARKRAAVAGLDVRFFDAVVGSVRDGMVSLPSRLFEEWLPELPVENRLEAFGAVCQAVRIVRVSAGQSFVAQEKSQPFVGLSRRSS